MLDNLIEMIFGIFFWYRSQSIQFEIYRPFRLVS